MARKKVEDDGGGGSPAWLGTYGDLVTLLMGFFVMLFASSSIDVDKYEKIAQSFNSNYVPSLLTGSENLLSGSVQSGTISLPMPSGAISEENLNQDEDGTHSITGSTEVLSEMERLMQEKVVRVEELGYIVEDLTSAISETDSASDITVEIDEDARFLTIVLPDTISFATGSHVLTPQMEDVLDSIAPILNNYPGNDIIIEGHTDSIPISTTRYPNNRMLSFWRSWSILEYLDSELGVDPKRMIGTGRGEEFPRADNSTPEGRAQNRRVEIKIYSVNYSDGM